MEQLKESTGIDIASAAERMTQSNQDNGSQQQNTNPE
jgi:hypothetical protein